MSQKTEAELKAEKEAAEAAAAQKKAAEEQAEAAAKAEKAKAARMMIVVHDGLMHDGQPVPAGTEVDPEEEWVKRCLLPFGDEIVVTQKVYKARLALAEAEKEAAPKKSAGAKEE